MSRTRVGLSDIAAGSYLFYTTIANVASTTSVLTVACTLGGPDGDPRSLAIARVTALKIGSITG